MIMIITNTEYDNTFISSVPILQSTMKVDMTSSPGSPYDVTISKGHVNDVTNSFVKSPELTRIQCSDNEGMISIYYDETDTILQTTAALETSFHSFSNTITINTERLLSVNDNIKECRHVIGLFFNGFLQ